jgi:hypothetical protein
MTTKKVAGRLLEQSPAVEFPQDLAESESLGAYDTTSSTPVTSYSRTFRARRVLSPALTIVAFMLLMVAFVELTEPVNTTRATLAIIAALVLWVLSWAVRP